MQNAELSNPLRLEDAIWVTACTERSGTCGCDDDR